MFCTSCGKKINDDSKFCPFCGQTIGQSTSSTPPTQPIAGSANYAAQQAATSAQGYVAVPIAPTAGEAPANQAGIGADQLNAAATSGAAANQAAPNMAAPAQTQAQASPQAANINEQVTAARSSSRRKLPMFVIVALVTLALAGTAFAAYMVYTHVIAPQQQTQTTEQPANDTDNEATNEAEQQAEEKGPESVYDEKLGQWVIAALNNWPDESSTGDADLANVSDVASGRASMAPGVPRELLDDKTVQFAYKDLNGDDKPELIIAVPYEEEFSDIDFAPIAIYTTDSNDNVISVTDGIGSQTSIWTLYKNGYLQCGGGGNAGTQLLYQIEDGTVVLAGEYSNQDIMTGAVSMPDRGENYTYSDFEWTDLVAMGDLVNDEIIAAEQAEASAAVDSVLSSMHSYENDYFYVDSESNVDTTVTDNGNGTWTVQWEAKPGARDTGGRVIVHMGGTPTAYSDQVGTASNGQLIWVEGVAGGTCGTFGVK